MAVIAPSPYYLRDSILSIAADDYAATITAMTLTPTTAVSRVPGLKAATRPVVVGNTDWVLDITLNQSSLSTGLEHYLLANKGLTKSITFQPIAGGAKWVVNAVIIPASFGGTVDGVPTSTVQLMVVGDPVYTAAV